jgi:hypothetical protein
MKAIILNRLCACSIAVAILFFAIGTMLAQPRTHLKLNEDAFAFAVQLIKQGHFIADGKGAWSKNRPSTDEENEFIRVHGFNEYAKWHLGIAISKTFIAVGCLLCRLEQVSTGIPKSKKQRHN